MEKEFLEWRAKQKRGAIMKPATFDAIVSGCMKKGHSEERCEKMAGSAYWQTAKSKYLESKKK